MKKLTLVSFLLCLILASCKEYDEVRIMPEFNNSETEVTLYKNVGSSATVVINTTANDITAEYNADWLSVDVDKRHVVYTVTAVNETGEPRTTIVKLHSGEWTREVTVTQREIDEADLKMLKVGQLTEDGLGMIFWVDPTNPEIGKAISLKRQSGVCEVPYKMNNAFSTVNGVANTALYTSPGANDAVTFCIGLGEGWYMPASGELADLFDAYNGIAHNDPAFVANNIEALTDTEKTARAKFDKMLTDLGGDVINATTTGAGESYWASTEVSTVTDGKNVIYVRFGKWLSQGGSKESTRLVRAMKLVGKYKFPEEPATLSVSPSVIDFTSEAGGTKEVTVTTNKDSYTYVVEGEDVTWLKHEQNGNKVTFTALSANTSDKARKVTVMFTAGSEGNQATATVTINQEKQPEVTAFQVGEYVTKDGGVDLAEGGIVFWTEGNTAKILSLKRYGPINWVNVKPTELLGVSDEDDGSVNTQKMKDSPSAGDIPVLAYCVDGWYWPARNELEEVFKVYNGGPSSAPVVPDKITEDEKKARAAWDLILTTHGGVVMNAAATSATGDSYFASTEHPSTVANAYYVRFGQWGAGLAAAKNAQNPARYIRLIRKVSK